MKKYSTFLSIAFLSIILGFSSCSKDDSVSNSFTHEGNEFILSKGFLEPYGSNFDGSYDFDVTLTSSGISFTEDGIVGAGDLIYLDLNTSSAIGLEEGTYTFTSERAPFTLVAAYVLIDYDLDTGLGQEEIEITGGTVDIELIGLDVDISFDLQRAGGDNITGSYRGELEDI